MDKFLKAKLIGELESILGPGNVLHRGGEVAVYEYDASEERGKPDIVVFVYSTHQVSKVAKLANREGVPFVARGSGTGLSGGAVAARGGVVIEMSKMDRILEIDIADQRAVVQPGVVNMALQNALSPYGFLYAPDPSSQIASSLGGNMAENAGGPHCLKYGVTTNHILGLEVVLPDGEVAELGGKALDMPGYDLVGIMVGSEGTLGIVTKIIVRIIPKQEAVKTMLAIFDTAEGACQAVSDIIKSGIVPATIEMIDRTFIQAVEAYIHAGYPKDAEVVLLIELDGLKDEMERLSGHIADICKSNDVREMKVAQTESEREQLWVGRKKAYGSIARISRSRVIDDIVVPRTRLPEMMRRAVEIGRKHSLLVGNIAHAGDGNLHPVLFYDDAIPGQKEKAFTAAREILNVCAELEGTISGEHGIGLDKIKAMPLVLSCEDMEAMLKVKRAFDPNDLCNPGKIFPADVYSKIISPQVKNSM
jgi:glycolate oxidase